MEEVTEVKKDRQTALTDDLLAVIDSLKDEYSEITGVAVVSSDGFLIASRPDANDEQVSAMSAFLLSSAHKAAEGLGWSELGYLVINHNDGYLVIADAGKATLSLSTSPRARLGLLLYDVRQAAKKIQKRIEEL